MIADVYLQCNILNTLMHNTYESVGSSLGTLSVIDVSKYLPLIFFLKITNSHELT